MGHGAWHPLGSNNDPAIHRDDGAGHEAWRGPRRARRRRWRCPRARPSVRGGCLGNHTVQHLCRHRFEDLGGDEARRHRVDTNLVLRQFAGPGAGHADDAGLGGHVVRLAEVAVEPDHRRRVEYDAAAGRDHVRDDGAGAVKTPLEVDVDDRVEGLVGHHSGQRAVFPLHQLAVPDDARVVDEHVDAAPAVDDGLDAPRDGSGFRHVHPNEEPLPAGLGDLLEEPRPRRLVHVEARHPAALAREAQGGGAADAGRGPGHDHDPSPQTRVHGPVYRRPSIVSRRGTPGAGDRRRPPGDRRLERRPRGAARDEGVHEPGGEDVAGGGGVHDRHRGRGHRLVPGRAESLGAARSARHHHEPQRVPGDRAPRRPRVGQEGRREVRLRPDEHVGRPRPRIERRHVGDHEATGRRLGQERGDVEVAAAEVDGVRQERGEPLRRAGLAAAVEVHDGALASGVHQHDRARAAAGDAGDRGDVDPRPLEPGEQPLRDVVAADRGDERDLVPGVPQRDRGVGPSPAEPELQAGRVEVAPRRQRVAQRDHVVLRDRAHHDDARQGSRLPSLLRAARRGGPGGL